MAGTNLQGSFNSALGSVANMTATTEAVEVAKQMKAEKAEQLKQKDVEKQRKENLYLKQMEEAGLKVEKIKTAVEAQKLNVKKQLELLKQNRASTKIERSKARLQLLKEKGSVNNGR
jgi:gamma-glutamylcysteine synthetase